ncbi:MAG: DUF4340 domain-containing protein [Gammaproteobacteria bacterium]
MNSRTLLNIGLLVLLLGLGLLVLFEPGIEPPPPPTTLTTFNQDDITHVRIDREQQEPLQLDRQQGGWRVLAEQPIPTSEFQVLSLLELAGTETKRSYPLDQLDLGKLGLDPASAKVTFNNELTIEFGTTEPLSGYRYVRVDDAVHLIKDRYQHLIEADISTFIDHRLLREGSRITRLQLPRMTLAYTDETHWSLVPEDPDVSADAIQELLDAWQHASALWVRKYAAGSAEAQAQVHIQLEGTQDTIEFEIMARQPELVLARPDWHIQYHLIGESTDKLFNFTKPTTDDDPQSDKDEGRI